MNPIDTCQKCQAEEDDLRTLWMACFYEMNELDLPFTKQTILEGGNEKDKRTFYTLRVCKNCRARWMDMIKTWFHFDFKRPSPKTGIYVRHYGTNIELTEEEWHDKFSGQVPIRFISNDEMPN
jgi:hypothetical protein